MFSNGRGKRDLSLLYSYGGVPAPVCVVDDSVEGLVNPLPEDYGGSRPGNTGNRKRKGLLSQDQTGCWNKKGHSGRLITLLKKINPH